MPLGLDIISAITTIATFIVTLIATIYQISASRVTITSHNPISDSNLRRYTETKTLLSNAQIDQVHKWMQVRLIWLLVFADIFLVSLVWLLRGLFPFVLLALVGVAMLIVMYILVYTFLVSYLLRPSMFRPIEPLTAVYYDTLHVRFACTYERTVLQKTDYVERKLRQAMGKLRVTPNVDRDSASKKIVYSGKFNRGLIRHTASLRIVLTTPAAPSGEFNITLSYVPDAPRSLNFAHKVRYIEIFRRLFVEALQV